jgi:hypothetical protein
MTSKTFILLAAVAVLSGGAAAIAQTDDDHGAHHPGTVPVAAVDPAGIGGAGAIAQMMPMMQAMMATDHVEGRIAYQKAELAITNAQMPQWTAVAGLLRLNAKAMRDEMARMAKDGMPTAAPARGDMMVMMMSERLEGMRKLGVANKALYAVLTPDQRKTADDMAAAPMGMM